MGITYTHPGINSGELQNTKDVGYKALKEAATPSERYRQAQHEAAKDARRRGLLEQPHADVERFGIGEIRDENHDAIDAPALVKDWIHEEYNDCITARVRDKGYARRIVMTNGSAAYQVKITTTGARYVVEAERYGETTEAKCKAGRIELMDALAATV